MKNNLKTLIQLSHIDVQLQKFKDAKIKFPQVIIDIQNHIEKLNHDWNHLENPLESLQKERAQVSQDLEEKTAWIQTREAHINEIKTTKEFQASVKEIATAKKFILDKTQMLTDLTSQITTATEDLAQKKLLLEPKIEEYKNKLTECQTKFESIEPKIESFIVEREQLLNVLSAEEQNHYKQTQKKVNPAVAKVDQKICSECGTRVPPQIINLLIAESQLQNCSACRRILYLEDTSEE